MVTEEERVAHNAKIQRAAEELRIAAADVTFAWAHVDDHLCDVLTIAMYGTHDNQSLKIASAILFSESNIDPRIKLVGRILKLRLEMWPDLEKYEKEKLFMIWGHIVNALEAPKSVRNTVAHGTPHYRKTNGEHELVVSSQSTNFARHSKPMPNAKELTESALLVGKLSGRMRRFRNTLMTILGDPAGRAEVIARLEKAILRDPL